MGQPATGLDLKQYFDRFKESLATRYDGSTFRDGFAAIEDRFREIRGGRLLTVEDILALFESNLPYIQDWTKPDRDDLARRLKEFRVPDCLKSLHSAGYEKNLIREIRYALREISLMGLILHHLYPDRFAICSHHIGSLLYVENKASVSEYYIDYCKELGEWASALSADKLNVAQTQFALWTWYRLAYFGRREDQRKHRRMFRDDPWIKRRRAEKIATSLGEIGRLDLAMSYSKSHPDVAAMIAWVEFERAVRLKLKGNAILSDRSRTIFNLIDELPELTPRKKEELKNLWSGRNRVFHQNPELPVPVVSIDDATNKIDGVEAFISDNLEPPALDSAIM